MLCEMIDKEGIKQTPDWGARRFVSLIDALGQTAEPMLPHLVKLKKRLKDEPSNRAVDKVIESIQQAVNDKRPVNAG